MGASGSMPESARPSSESKEPQRLVRCPAHSESRRARHLLVALGFEMATMTARASCALAPSSAHGPLARVWRGSGDSGIDWLPERSERRESSAPLPARRLRLLACRSRTGAGRVSLLALVAGPFDFLPSRKSGNGRGYGATEPFRVC